MAKNQTELQILALAKEGLTPEQIAVSLGLDEEAVMYVLARHGELKEDEVSDDDFQRIKNRLIDIAKNTEDDYLAANVGKFLWERKKGAIKDFKNAPSINVGRLNLLISGANDFVSNFQKRLNGNSSNTIEISNAGRNQTTPPPKQEGETPAGVERPSPETCETK